MRLLATTIVVGACLFAGPHAKAGPTNYSVTVSFGETYTQAQGGAGITDDLAQPYTFSLAGVGSATSSVPMALWSPLNGGSCTGLGCVGATETDPVSASFTFTSPSSTTPTTITVNGTFYAKYSGTHLPCDTTGGSQSDCVIWTGSTSNTGAGYLDVSINFTDGAILTMRVFNAQDWDITNYVKFTETKAPAVPEPSTIALLGFGLLGTLAVARRKTR